MKTKVDVKKLYTLTGHNDAVYTLKSSELPHVIFSGSGDGIVARWDLREPETGVMIAKVPNSVYAIDYLPRLALLALGHNYDGIHLVDAREKKELFSVSLTKAAIFEATFINEFLLIGTGDGKVIVFDYDKRITLKVLELSNQRVRTIERHPKKQLIAVGSSDKKIRLLNIADWTLVKEFNAHTNSVFAMKFSPDGKYLFSVGRDAQIRIWDVLGDYVEIEKIPAHLYAINDIAFSPDGRYFVTCSLDKTIKVWDYQKLKLLKVIDKARHGGHGTSVNKVLWSSYNNLLISCSDDRTIAVWDLTFEQSTP